ncbi:MFS transporter [Paracidovorax valerianellae]|uniref:Predicted arabinose efflux permease, MFS family n=1 Tax=Paracidovorax valerianellae TaxID=187868 RepID=A0A1G6T147_9BURK|nr:MFS transporter [Paracidovorax valerianellae]MDA8445474.1 MFS transporter [Paracidovorax valerianellae]SDD22890.1 Predicted arabinose efflux permease, MFS family [Paracidovorax valerianellae]
MTSTSPAAGPTGAAPRRPLTRHDYQTLGLSALGGTLEFYDFVIYVFFAAVLGGLFFPADMPDWLRQLQTFGIFAAGYLARPVGGIVIAHFGDKLGRKRMFTLSIFLMAVPTLVIGLLPTYASIGVAAPLLLLAMRVLQGAAIGGEMPGAWVFVAEHVPANRYGLGVGTLTAGITGGILLGSLVAIGINRSYAPAEVQEFAWRIPFILGGVFGLVSVYLRRFLHETPVFQELAARRAVARELPVKTVLRDHRGAMLLVALMTWVLSTAIVVVVLITPTYLQKVFHIPATLALEANAVATLTLTIGCVIVGWATDRFGTRPVMLVGWGGLVVTTYLFYTGLPGTPASLVFHYGLIGLFVGSIALLPIVGVRAFPPEVRFTGLSFSYNMAYAVFGGITPILITLWQQHDVLANAHYVAAMGVLGFALGFVPLASRGWQPAAKA